jgi:galactokinase
VGYKPNASKRVRLYSANFPGDGVIEFEVGKVPPPLSKEVADSWARFPYGVDYILNQNGYGARVYVFVILVHVHTHTDIHTIHT